MQARRISFVKDHLNAIFKEHEQPSITLKLKLPRQLNEDNHNKRYEDKRFLSSCLCINKHRAKLDELIWFEEYAKLYTIYPQQKVNISDWLSCPSGQFPLYTNNCCQISSDPDLKMHILVEVDIYTYKHHNYRLTTVCAKLEDYGLIIAWTKSESTLNFIVETDIEHVMTLIIGVIQGRCCINYGLYLTRVQSVLVSGKPCIYNDTHVHLGSPPNKNGYYLKCETDITSSQKKSKGIKVRGMSIRLQDKNSEIFTEDFFAKNVKSNSAPASSNSSPTEDRVGLFIKNPYNRLLLNEQAVFEHWEKPDLTKTYLPNTIEKKDNINEQSENIDENKSRETTSKSSELEVEENFSNTIKPPNILIYADTFGTIDNLKNLLSKVLEPTRYDIHVFSKDDNNYKIWVDQVSLVVLCGNVGELGAQFVEYVIQGGKLLALCSDMLHILLPSFKTAEVRENELVHFSYGKWKQVHMMHHIFCYHASPVRTRFSQDHEDTRASAVNPPTSINVKDKKGNLHSFDVKVLGREETWHNPSILLATLPSSGGKVVFSQIHLEIDPMQYIYEEDQFKELNKSNAARLEIISDLLSTHLGLDVNYDSRIDKRSVQYTPGYFLGTFEMKMKMLKKLKATMKNYNTLKLLDMEIQFCTNNENVKPPSANFLPIMTHMCPSNFSTVDYFENLCTRELGRLVIYADVLTSSMRVSNARLKHGLVVIPREQTCGQGRYHNKWFSPNGCAMFTLQVHIFILSNLGRYISLIQHIAAVALVSAVRSIKGYEDINIRIKWPNDIYIGNSIKIGGIITSTRSENAYSEALFVCNIGAGINLSNSKPTTCINDAILQYNQKYGTKLETLSHEKYLALVFNEMETLLDIVQNGNSEHFYRLYYKYWLHTNANVTVTRINGGSESVKILGIDEYGYLLVAGKKGIFSVQSDGNSFNLFKGLIVPK